MVLKLVGLTKFALHSHQKVTVTSSEQVLFILQKNICTTVLASNNPLAAKGLLTTTIWTSVAGQLRGVFGVKRAFGPIDIARKETHADQFVDVITYLVGG